MEEWRDLMNTFQPTISIVIPVYNGGEAFKKCLTSVKSASSPSTEILVVADGDTDGSGNFAEENGVKVMRLPNPGGPARARNLGAQQAKGDVLFFVDADVTISEDAVSRIFDFFQEHPEIAAIFGSYDDEPFEANLLSQYKNLFHHYVHQTGSAGASTFWAGCGAIRRDIFLKMSGFDEHYRHPCIEDIELGYRLKKAGYHIRLAKDLQVKHLKRWTAYSLLKADIFYRALPWTDLILREDQFINDLNVKTSDRVSVMLVFLLVLSGLGGLLFPQVLLLTPFLMAGLLMLNGDVYRFFYQKRGLWFTLLSIPWHWLYFFYSGLAFSIGFIKFRMRRIQES